MSVRVLVVDDHPVVRAGLVALLAGQDDLEVVGEAPDSATAVALVGRCAPDLVLMDLQLGAGPDGVATTEVVRALPHPPQVLVLTTYDTDADVVRALDAGAVGYLLKDAPPAELFAGIRAAARGETVLSQAAASHLVRRTTATAPVVTEREAAVLQLLADGLANKEIARRLLVSEATVKSHLSHIYTKLGVETRTGAVAAGIDLRIVRR